MSNSNPYFTKGVLPVSCPVEIKRWRSMRHRLTFVLCMFITSKRNETSFYQFKQQTSSNLRVLVQNFEK
jgi:hypothetical protein